MRGAVEVIGHENVRLHNYIAGERSFELAPHITTSEVTTQILETPGHLVLFDCQFATSDAMDMADYAVSLGKPVERIILSHGHPDHWFGLEALRRRFPEASTYALEPVRCWMATYGPTILERHRIRRAELPSMVTIPDLILPEKPFSVDGVVVEVERVDCAEADVQLVCRIPALRILLAFDLVFPAPYHVITVDDSFGEWCEALAKLARDESFDQVAVGHGPMCGRSAIKTTQDYLKSAQKAHVESSAALEFAGRLKHEYPGRKHPEWVDFASERLYTAGQ